MRDESVDVVVIGGGNTAIDAAVQARRLGVGRFGQVVIAAKPYRRIGVGHALEGTSLFSVERPALQPKAVHRRWGKCVQIGRIDCA